MDPEKKSWNFIFPTKYVIPKSLKFSHWPSKKKAQIENDSNMPVKRKGCFHHRFHKNQAWRCIFVWMQFLLALYLVAGFNKKGKYESK